MDSREKGTAGQPSRIARHILPHLFRDYVVGCIVTAMLLMWSGIQTGAFQRYNSPGFWLLLGIIYAAIAGLWPILVILFVLAHFGLIQSPLDWPIPNL